MKTHLTEGSEVIVTDNCDPMVAACALRQPGDVVQPIRGWHTVAFCEDGKSDCVFGPSARLIRASGKRVEVVSAR